jgi:hypothetical protein
MPLMTLKAVAEDLGLSSEQSVRNLVARGELTIVRVTMTGTRGSPRIDSEDLASFKRRLAERARRGDAEAAAKKSSPASPLPPVRRQPRRPAPVPPALRALRRPGAVKHFE